MIRRRRSADALGGRDPVLRGSSEDDDARKAAMGFGYAQAPIVVIRDEAGKALQHFSGFQTNDLKALAD